MTDIITLNRDSLPSFLIDSELNNTISVPKGYSLSELSLEKPEDIIQPLYLINYFKNEYIPFEIIDFIIRDMCRFTNDERKAIIKKYITILSDETLKYNQYAEELKFLFSGTFDVMILMFLTTFKSLNLIL